jgi:hypothetical protein
LDATAPCPLLSGRWVAYRWFTYKALERRRHDFLARPIAQEGQSVRAALKMGGLVLIGAGLGLVSALAMLNQGMNIGKETVQGWVGSHVSGDRTADPYTRALVARAGLLALTQAETLYFNRTTNEMGKPLRADCTYQLEGGPQPARWWSVTIYAADNYLPVNGDDAQSADATRMAALTKPQDLGRWKVRVSPQKGDATHWISSKNAGNYALTIRLYNPQDGARNDFKSIALPTIKTVSCPSVPA